LWLKYNIISRVKQNLLYEGILFFWADIAIVIFRMLKFIQMSSTTPLVACSSACLEADADNWLIRISRLFAGRLPLQLILKENQEGLVRIEAGLAGKSFISFIFKKPGKPVIFLLPGAGASDRSKKLFLKRFSFLLHQGHPLALCHFENSFPRSDEDFFRQIKQQVALISSGLDFWEKFTGIAGQDFFFVAVSAGGFSGIIAASLDKRLKKILLLGCGGDCEVLTWRGLLRLVLKKDCPRKACVNMHRAYRQILKKSLYAQLPLLPRHCFLYDPLTLAPAIADRSILMINGLFDLVVPFSCALRLRHRLGKPPLLWYPGTHLMLPWFLPFFRKKLHLFFLAD